jgi:nucleoside-diphosphate-sugar epimerase
VNCGAVKLLVQLLRKNQRLVFPSTASCYGDMPSGICHEETVLNPVSAYGREKAEAERIVAQHGNTVVLRLATAFGLSPRLRLDLLINDFVYQALKNKHLIVYEKDFRRSFVHVRDIARAFLFCLDNFEKMCGQTFNVGSSHLNLTKEEIALGIRKRLDFILHFADAGHDEDLRNYYLSFDKIERLGFRCVVDLDTGINELIRGLDVVEVKNPFSNI